MFLYSAHSASERNVLLNENTASHYEVIAFKNF